MSKISFRKIRKKAIVAGIIVGTMSLAANQGYCVNPQTHEYIAHALLEHPLVSKVHGLSSDGLKDRYKDSDRLDFASGDTKDKYHHVTSTFANRAYATDQNWRNLSREDRLEYLLHDMGDSCMAMGHFGSWDIGSYQPEFWIENRLQNSVDKMSDITNTTNNFWANYSYSMNRSEAWAKYAVDQQNVNTWMSQTIQPLWEGHERTKWYRQLKLRWYRDAIQDRGNESFFGCPAGSSLSNGFSMSVYHLLDFFLLEKPIEGSIKSETTSGDDMRLSFEGYDPDAFIIKSNASDNKYTQELGYTNGAGITKIEWDLDADGVFESVVTKPQDSIIDTSVLVNSMSLFGNYMRNGVNVPIASCRVTDDDGNYAGNGIDQSTKVFHLYLQ